MDNVQKIAGNEYKRPNMASNGESGIGCRLYPFCHLQVFRPWPGLETLDRKVLGVSFSVESPAWGSVTEDQPCIAQTFPKLFLPLVGHTCRITRAFTGIVTYEDQQVSVKNATMSNDDNTLFAGSSPAMRTDVPEGCKAAVILCGFRFPNV
jgi:hypothetical protein